MDKYKNYMDSAEPSAEFVERLEGLTAQKRPPAWRKYGAMAAALALVIGLGTWGLTRLSADGGNTELAEGMPEIGEVVAPVPENNTVVDTETTQTMGGYEVREGEVASYYMLPYIQYGKVDPGITQDMAPPVGVYRRDLTQEELLALLDGEKNLTQHLNWGSYELYAFAMLNRDGSLWQLHIEGRKGDTGLEHFSLEIRPGGLPATCIVYPESESNEVWGVEVTADGHDGDHASSRRVSFLHEDYGYRFEITGADVGAIEELTARTLRFFIMNCCPYFAPTGNSEGYTGGNGDGENTLPYDPSAGAEPAEPVDPAVPSPTPTPVVEGEWSVRISAEDVTSTGLTLVLERTAEGGSYMTGTPFHLERYEDGQWIKMDVIPYEGEGVRGWTDIGWLFPDEVGGRYEHSVGWTLWYGELSAGQYRMAKEVFVSGGKTILYAEFEITD